MKEDEKSIMLAKEYLKQLHLSNEVNIEENIINIFDNLVNPMFKILYPQFIVHSEKGYENTFNKPKLEDLF